MSHETPAGRKQRPNTPLSVSVADGTSKKSDTIVLATNASRSHRRAAILLLSGALLALLAVLLQACGSIGSTSFTGGGVPIGGSRVFGRVVSASNTSISLSNVSVRIKATPDGGTERDLQTTTDGGGAFNFSNVLPGFSNGTLVVTATPPDPTYQVQEIALRVPNGHTEQMILTLAPAQFDNTTAKTVQIAIASPALPSGVSVQVQAVVRDAAQKILPVKPSLVFDGNFGNLAADGTFTVPAGTLSGVGSITAFWYRLPPQSQQIHVDNNASPPPPLPPLLPGIDQQN